MALSLPLPSLSSPSPSPTYPPPHSFVPPTPSPSFLDGSPSYINFRRVFVNRWLWKIQRESFCRNIYIIEENFEKMSCENRVKAKFFWLLKVLPKTNIKKREIKMQPDVLQSARNILAEIGFNKCRENCRRRLDMIYTFVSHLHIQTLEGYNRI